MAPKKEDTARILFFNKEMDRQTAVDRYQRFHDIKLSIIQRTVGGANQEALMVYSSSAFLNLLKYVATNNDLTGLRVYLACYVPSKRSSPEINMINDRERIPVGKEGCLTLIFVPTEDINGNDLTDTGTYLIFNAAGTSLIKMQDHEEVKDWIDEYRKNEIGGIRYELNKSLGGGDRETKSIWYSKKTISDTYNDILVNHSSVSYITAFFGAYKSNESEYVDYGAYNNGMRNVHPSDQLTLIYGTGPYPLQIAQEMELMKERSSAGTRSEPADYDTGAPCPPAPGCEGSGFYP